MDIDAQIKYFDNKYNSMLHLPKSTFFLELSNYYKKIRQEQPLLAEEFNKKEAEYLTKNGTYIPLNPPPLEKVEAYSKKREKVKQLLSDDYASYFDLGFVWNELRSIHILLTQIDDVAEEKPNEILIERIREIFDNSEKKGKYYSQETYSNYLTILHNFVISELNNMRNSQAQMVYFPPNQTVIYQNQRLFFKQGDGSSASVSFANSPQLRPLFEAFWETRKRKEPGTTIFDLGEVFQIYKELHSYDYLGNLTDDLGNIRQLVYDHNKIPKNRFKINYHSDGKEIFWVK